MTLVIQKPTGAKLVMAQTYVGIDDPDAAAYITAVEAADTAAGQSGGLETAVKVAIHSFVKGCKADGIWPAIKASCILAGARTLSGALVPLVGTAPTNVGGLFVSGDYNRKTGLVGNGSSKYIDTQRAANQQPLNSLHLAVFATTADNGANKTYIGASSLADVAQSTYIQIASNSVTYRINNGGTHANGAGTATGFIGASRDTSSNFASRALGQNVTHAVSSTTAHQNTLHVFSRNLGTSEIFQASAARLAFYSIGESLNLALLDARVTDLINAFGVAIP
jgi:hypothetical protein